MEKTCVCKHCGFHYYLIPGWEVEDDCGECQEGFEVHLKEQEEEAAMEAEAWASFALEQG